MPRIRKAQLIGLTLEELKEILNAVIADETYTPESIEKVRAKIEKRLRENGGGRLSDEDMIDQLFEDFNMD